jgi:hypothetical protein
MAESEILVDSSETCGKLTSQCKLQVQSSFWICLTSFQVSGQNSVAALQPSPLNKAAAFCCRDSSLTSNGFKVSVSAVQLTALTSDSVNRDNPERDGVAAPSTDYGLKLPVGHEGLSRVGDNALGSVETKHTRTIPQGLGKLSLSPLKQCF